MEKPETGHKNGALKRLIMGRGHTGDRERCTGGRARASLNGFEGEVEVHPLVQAALHVHDVGEAGLLELVDGLERAGLVPEQALGVVVLLGLGALALHERLQGAADGAVDDDLRALVASHGVRGRGHEVGVSLCALEVCDEGIP